MATQTITLSIKIDQPLNEALERFAEINDDSKSKVVKRALKAYLNFSTSPVRKSKKTT